METVETPRKRDDERQDKMTSDNDQTNKQTNKRQRTHKVSPRHSELEVLSRRRVLRLLERQLQGRDRAHCDVAAAGRSQAAASARRGCRFHCRTANHSASAGPGGGARCSSGRSGRHGVGSRRSAQHPEDDGAARRGHHVLRRHARTREVSEPAQGITRNSRRGSRGTRAAPGPASAR